MNLLVLGFPDGTSIKIPLSKLHNAIILFIFTKLMQSGTFYEGNALKSIAR